VVNYTQWQPWVAQALTTPEYVLPLLYILGLSRPSNVLQNSVFSGKTIDDDSMRSLRLG